jgi:hypothetical protein
MQVRARNVDTDTAPAEIRLYLRQVYLTTGQVYAVCCIALFEGVVVLQVVDDLRMPSWLPAWFFEVVDRSMPADWICSLFVEDPTLVLGPEFVAQTQEAYAAMVELHPEQVDRFWKRFDLIQGPSADDI